MAEAEGEDEVRVAAAAAAAAEVGKSTIAVAYEDWEIISTEGWITGAAGRWK